MATIDSSIYSQIQPIQIESPINALAKVTQLKNAQNQNRLFDMQVADSERARAGENALNDAYRKAYRQDGSLDEQGLVSNLAQSGQGGKIAGIQEGFAKTAKAKAEATKFQLDNSLKTLDVVSQSLGPTLQNPALYPQVKAALMQKYPEGAANLPDQFDPAAIQAVINKTLTAKDQISIKQKELDQVLARDKFSYDQRNDAANRGVTIRGQNMTDSRGREAIDVSREKLNYDKSKPGKVANMSATMQKELFEADDTVQSSKNVIGLLDQALKLNDKAYSGLGAKERAAVRGQLPGDKSSADATINLDNIMTGQALESLKSVFGGMPTEGERKILLDIQASADKTPSQRKLIIDRARSAAQNRMKFNESKAKSLRDGSYTTTGPAPVEPEPNNIESLLDKYK